MSPYVPLFIPPPLPDGFSRWAEVPADHPARREFNRYMDDYLRHLKALSEHYDRSFNRALLVAIAVVAAVLLALFIVHAT